MIPKPKYLTGEVKEFCSAMAYYSAVFDPAPFKKKFEEVGHFYSQQFQPEMITEYFEGWTQTDFEEYHTENGDVISFDGGVMTIMSGDSGIEVEVTPNTLSQLISLFFMEEVQIKLTWKENEN